MKTRVYETREAMLESMARIVRREVKHYQTDFTDYDRKFILDPEYVTEGSAWYWMTRDSGTHLIRFNFDDPAVRIRAWNYIRAVLECFGPENVKVRQIIKGCGCISIDSPEDSWRVLRTAQEVLKEAI